MPEEIFLVEPTDYTRNRIIAQLLDGLELKRIKIMPCFKKKEFLSNFSRRKFILNDFFVSTYDSEVKDRQEVAKCSLRALKFYAADLVNFRFSRYLLSDTGAHLKYWTELFGRTRARTFVLPILANTEIYQPLPRIQTNGSTLRLLFFGTFIPLHGLDVIVRAMKRLKEKNLDIKAKLIGRGQTFPEMVELIKKLQLEDMVMVTGEGVSQPELVVEMDQADLVLGIFGSSRKARSVVPNKAYEAMACRKCLVTMRSEAMDEFFSGDDACLVDNNPAALASAIEELHRDRARIDHLAEHGYKTFQALYERTRQEFRQFVREIDAA